MTLKELEIGQKAIVTAVGSQGALRQHLLDMGIIPGAKVKMIRSAPMGDPIEIRIHDYELTLRENDAGHITIKPVKDTESAENFINTLKTLKQKQKKPIAILCMNIILIPDWGNRASIIPRQKNTPCRRVQNLFLPWQGNKIVVKQHFSTN